MQKERCILCSIIAILAACRPGWGESLAVIKAARVITVSGKEYAPGTVVIEDGKISAVGGDIEYPASAGLIRAPRETVMPGLIHPRSRFSLKTYSRSGVHGDQSVTDEVYLSRMRFDDLLAAGFVAVTFVPDGSDIPGVAATFRTAGPDESRLLGAHSYLQVVPNWRSNGRKVLSEALEKANKEIEKVQKAREEWEKKQKEKAEKGSKEGEENSPEEGDEEEEDKEGDDGRFEEQEPGDQQEGKSETDKKEQPEEFQPPKIDPKYQPLVDLIEKKEGAQMMVTLTRASDFLHLDAVLEPYEDLAHVLYLATAQSSDYHHVVETLAARKAIVVLRPWIHFLPQTTFRYNLVHRLDRAGCTVAVAPWDDSRQELSRVRQRVAELLRTGLSREAGLKAMTLNPAKAIGLGDQLGSLDKGKYADLAFFDGDPLDPHSAVTRVMIRGEMVWKKDRQLAERK